MKVLFLCFSVFFFFVFFLVIIFTTGTFSFFLLSFSFETHVVEDVTDAVPELPTFASFIV